MKILQIKDKVLSNFKLMLVVIIVVAGVGSPVNAMAEMVTIDPELAIAIGAQTTALQESYKQRNKMREAILGVQSEIAGTLITIHSVEEEALKYMRDASSVFRDLVMIKNIFESSGQLASNAWNLIEDIPNNLKGTAITALCYRKIEGTVSDCTEMATLLSELVMNTEYGGKDDGNNKNGKKHVNLLNSAERYHILVDVNQRLDRLNLDIKLIRYYLRTLDWTDIWKSFDYESYINAITAKRHMNGVIASWNALKKK